MLPEEKDLIYKHFPQLVQECDLNNILKTLTKKGRLTQDNFEEITEDIRFEEDTYHNNRRILFKILDYKKANIFPILLEGLRETGFGFLADILGNKLVAEIKKNLDPLDVNINVKLSTKFYDSEAYNNTSFYSTRSRNRGHVLIINNIKFSNGNEERHGAEADGRNLRELFERMGLHVVPYTNLNAYDMYVKTQEFATTTTQATLPDIGIVIIMSHGVVIRNETMIISSDNKLVPEDDIRSIFNNENCPLFRRKPKIFIYHICRSILKEPIDTDTTTDANLISMRRTYSDMLICHPSVKGFVAHRNNVKGSWYIQLLCKVFMNFAHEMDIESLLKKVDEELEIVSALPWKLDDQSHSTEQTSTYQNIAFKKCYLHPGIYEEDNQIMYFKQSQ